MKVKKTDQLDQTGQAYSYVRFSTADQLKGDSQRRQVEAAEAWCSSRGIELVDHYRDLGVSAYRGKNAAVGALGRFLELVRAKRIPRGSFLIVESLDRLSRADILEALEQFLGIVRSGVRIVTLADNQEYDVEHIKGAGWVSLIISITIMSRAHEESVMKSKRGAAAWINKRARAQNGVKMTARCPSWLKLSADRTRFEVIQSPAAVVRRCFHLAKAGKTPNDIAAELRDSKVLPISGRGRDWRAEAVRKILKNRAAIGTLIPGHWEGSTKRMLEPIEGYYPPVIDKGTFAAVQQMIVRRDCGAWKLKPRTSRSVFGGLIFGLDGHSFYYEDKGIKGGRRYHYIRASGHRYGKRALSWNYDDFLEAFVDVCQTAALTEPPKDTGSDIVAAKQEAVAEAEALVQKRADLLEQTNSDTMRKRLADAEAGLSAAMAALAKAQATSVATATGTDEVDWSDGTKLRESIRRTVKRIVVEINDELKGFDVTFFDGRRFNYVQTPDGDRVQVIRKTHAASGFKEGEPIKFKLPEASAKPEASKRKK